MKTLGSKVHSWMERNLEEPLFKAEIAKAQPSASKDGTSTVVYISVTASLVLMVCWLFISAV